MLLPDRERKLLVGRACSAMLFEHDAVVVAALPVGLCIRRAGTSTSRLRPDCHCCLHHGAMRFQEAGAGRIPGLSIPHAKAMSVMASALP